MRCHVDFDSLPRRTSQGDHWSDGLVAIAVGFVFLFVVNAVWKCIQDVLYSYWLAFYLVEVLTVISVIVCAPMLWAFALRPALIWFDSGKPLKRVDTCLEAVLLAEPYDRLVSQVVLQVRAERFGCLRKRRLMKAWWIKHVAGPVWLTTNMTRFLVSGINPFSKFIPF